MSIKKVMKSDSLYISNHLSDPDWNRDNFSGLFDRRNAGWNQLTREKATKLWYSAENEVLPDA